MPPDQRREGRGESSCWSQRGRSSEGRRYTSCEKCQASCCYQFAHGRGLPFGSARFREYENRIENDATISTPTRTGPNVQYGLLKCSGASGWQQSSSHRQVWPTVPVLQLTQPVLHHTDGLRSECVRRITKLSCPKPDLTQDQSSLYDEQQDHACVAGNHIEFRLGYERPPPGSDQDPHSITSFDNNSFELIKARFFRCQDKPWSLPNVRRDCTTTIVSTLLTAFGTRFVLPGSAAVSPIRRG